MEKSEERIILAGGCFWGMEALIQSLPGVTDTRVGYSGGDVLYATYENHGTHAEAVEVKFQTSVITLRELLEYFFQIHDPSTKNRQGNDIGSSYRSAIFYTSDNQKAIAEELMHEVNTSGIWPGEITTELLPAGDFWVAEKEHQNYLKKHPNGYTCHFVRKDWVLSSK